MPRWSDEETTNPHHADDRNFYKVEGWTTDGLHIDGLLYAGNQLWRAQEMLDAAIGFDPDGNYTIRQRTRVLDKWPK